MNYVFAGKEMAAERLKKLHEVFCKSSEFFVRNNVKNKVNVCIDLGCGTGHTTRDLASWINAKEYIGLDNSSYFIEEAKKLSKNYPQIKYRLHDITKIPFPTKKSDVIYTRFLLTHLENLLGSIKKWGTQLNPKGVLLIEETESIKTNVPVFQKYITISDKLLKSNKNLLFIGKFLENLNYEKELLEFNKKYSEACNIPVVVKDAAIMFLLNIPSWRNHEFIKENYTDIEINKMEDELLKLSNILESNINNNNNLFIEWDLRQIVLVKNYKKL